MDLQDPTSVLFSLHDATESIEQESLNEGISAMLEALNQARSVLRDIIIPTGRVSLCFDIDLLLVPYRL